MRMPLSPRPHARMARAGHPDQLNFDFGDPGPQVVPAGRPSADDGAAAAPPRRAVRCQALCQTREPELADDRQLSLF